MPVAETVKNFITDAYQIVSASSPTVPLQGDDMLKGVQFLNDLLQAYSATGLLTTIAREITYTLAIGQQNVTFGDTTYVPLPNVTIGRLSNIQNAWLLLQGVTYPLIIQNRNEFLASFKYDPQLGLPRYGIVYNQTDLTTLRLFPGPSQQFELHVYGKFQLPVLTENDNMGELPSYQKRFLKLAVARDLAIYKGRLSAWTQDLRDLYLESKLDMESVSSINLNIEADLDSSLNGAWRVKAGI